jgi:DNA-directed RNA polymerase subunit alpha
VLDSYDRGGVTLVTETKAATIKCVAESEDYARFEIEPLQRGFGTTLGNAMRRVLLSSLTGAAVTWVRIEGVQHEFTTIPHVEEDITEILLNVKDVRLRAFSDKPGTPLLDVTGEGEVTAADIQPTADYEIVNPELHLATLDTPDARLSMEFNVERGVGYVPADESDGLAIGVTPVDAIFTPVRKVNYSIERTRVGQMTNFERLTLEVWTDGSITPAEAVRQSAQILVDQLAVIIRLGQEVKDTGDTPPLVGVSISQEEYDTPIERLELSVRAFNCLKRSGISKVGEVLQMTEEELLAVKNFGQKSLDELIERLATLGYSLQGPPPGSEGSGAEETLDVSTDEADQTGDLQQDYEAEDEAADSRGLKPQRVASLEELAKVFGIDSETDSEDGSTSADGEDADEA